MADPAPRGEESASLRKTGAADTEAAAAARRRRKTGREEGEDMAEEEALLGFLMASFSFFSSSVLSSFLFSLPRRLIVWKTVEEFSLFGGAARKMMRGEERCFQIRKRTSRGFAGRYVGTTGGANS